MGENDPNVPKRISVSLQLPNTKSKKSKEKMGSNACFSFILYFFLLISLVSASPFISDLIFNSDVSTGRSLLQATEACKIDFENQNYTILTSQCKGPTYPPKVCCEALKQFACPFADEINDSGNNCASVMFSYINLYGKYPPGLFANLCKEGKQGLDCSSVKAASPAPSNVGQVSATHSLLLMITVAFLVTLFQFV